MTDHELNELKHRVEGAHRAVPGAHDPAADVWQRARSQVSTNQKREQPIMSMTPTYSIPSTPGRISTRRNSNGLSRFVSMAATLVIVGLLAFGGWFAATNLPPNDGSRDMNLAMAPATPDTSAICDVEPLTVDEVMEIVQNPYRYLANRSTSKVIEPPTVYYGAREEALEPPLLPMKHQFLASEQLPPSDSEFGEAHAAVTRYLNCISDATNGQYWAMVDPTWVQYRILELFPVYVNESEVRAYVEQSIHEPASQTGDVTSYFRTMYPDAVIAANPNRDEAISVRLEGELYRPLLAVGLVVTDSRGRVIDGTSQIDTDGVSTMWPGIIVGKAPTTGDWYVLSWLVEYSPPRE